MKNPEYEAINIIVEFQKDKPECSFIEIENDQGKSIKIGQWSKRANYHVLRITSLPKRKKTENQREKTLKIIEDIISDPDTDLKTKSMIIYDRFEKDSPYQEGNA